MDCLEWNIEEQRLAGLMIRYDLLRSLLYDDSRVGLIGLPGHSVTISPVKASASGMIKVAFASQQKPIVTVEAP